jgi:hypothetical protein
MSNAFYKKIEGVGEDTNFLNHVFWRVSWGVQNDHKQNRCFFGDFGKKLTCVFLGGLFSCHALPLQSVNSDNRLSISTDHIPRQTTDLSAIWVLACHRHWHYAYMRGEATAHGPPARTRAHSGLGTPSVMFYYCLRARGPWQGLQRRTTTPWPHNKLSPGSRHYADIGAR